MHEGLSQEEFELLKADVTGPVSKKAWNAAKVKTYAWSQLTSEQMTEVGKGLGTMVVSLAKNLWSDPEFYRKISLSDIDTSVLGQGLKSETSRMGWFLYFLKEAVLRSSKTPQQEEELLAIARKYLRKPLTGQGSEFKVPIDSVDPALLRADLTKMLKIGFSALSGFGEGHGEDDCSDAALMQYRRTGQVYQEVDFRWRADSRDFDAVKKEQGFKTKADSEGYAKNNGMRDPYHPFSDPTVRKYLWFRRGQTDNCLYTVVSVGKSIDWKGYLPFPKVEQTLPKELFASGGRAPISTKYSERYAMCKVGGLTKSIKLPCTETWLYMFLLTGLVIETNRIQNAILGGDAFPEEGVREIPLGDIFGAVKFYRFHHGPKDEDGFTAVPADGGVLQFRNPFFQETKYSRKGFDMLQRPFADAAGTGPVSVRWAANGYQTISSGFDFKGEKIDQILGLSLQT